MSTPLHYLDSQDRFDYRVHGGALGDTAHVSLDGITVASQDADQLEQVAEQFMLAARDLRIARLRHTCDSCSTYQPGAPLVSKGVETNGVVNRVSLCSPCAFEDWGADYTNEALNKASGF